MSLIATSVEAMKSVLAVKGDFAKVINLKQKHILDFADNQDQWFDFSIDFHKSRVFRRDQGGRYQTSRHRELKVSIS